MALHVKVTEGIMGLFGRSTKGYGKKSTDDVVTSLLEGKASEGTNAAINPYKSTAPKKDITSTTDGILREEALGEGAESVIHHRFGKSGDATVLKQKFGGEDMRNQVYPDGNTSAAQSIGSAITGTGRRVSNALDFGKEAAARALGGQKQARNVLKDHAESLEGGLPGAAGATSTSAGEIGHTLLNQVEKIEAGHRAAYKNLGGLDTVDKPDFIIGGMHRLYNKYSFKKTTGGKGINKEEPSYLSGTDEGKGVLHEIETWITSIQEGSMTPSQAIRALRRRVGERSHVASAGQKNLPEQHDLQRLNKDMRSFFEEVVEQKAKSLKKTLPTLQRNLRQATKRGDTETAEAIKKQIWHAQTFKSQAEKVDQSFSRWKKLETKAKPGSGEMDAVALIKVMDKPDEASKLMNGLVNDMTNGVTRLSTFRKRVAAVEKVSGEVGLVAKVDYHLQQTMSHNLFQKDIQDGISTNFAKALNQKNGRDLMKSVWPEHKNLIDDWSYVMRRTADSAEGSSFLTRALSTMIGGGAGAAAAVAGVGVGVTMGVAGLVGTATYMGLQGLLKTKGFQNFAIKQFSKAPYERYKALGKLGDIIEKNGGDRVNAKRVLDWMVGAPIVLGVGSLALDYAEENKEFSISEEKYNRIQAKYGDKPAYTAEEEAESKSKYERIMNKYK